MDYRYTPVDALVNGGAMDLGVLTTLGENDRYFNRVLPNVSYRWKAQGVKSNGGGANLMTVQSGSVLVPAFSGPKEVAVSLNYPAKDNLYVITTGLRHQAGIQATTVTVGQTQSGFKVKIVPINSKATYSGVYLTWIAVVGRAGD